MLFSTVFQLYHSGKCTYSCFPGVVLNSTPHNIISKPLAAFHVTTVETTDSGERGMNLFENDYRQSSKRILAELGIEPATSCSQVRNATD